MKTILVIGANGFVGSHALKSLSQVNDIRLIAACRNKSKLDPNFQGEVREGDLLDSQYLSKLLNGVDVVCNAMAWTSLWSHSNQSRILHYEPTIALIDQYIQSNANRFIHISTTSAASPENSTDSMSLGIKRSYWPHLCNVIDIENYIREHASSEKTMINLRLGIFADAHYSLGILPILIPRLKTHLVPWVAGGKNSLPIIDARDIGEALKCAAIADGLEAYESFNVVGKEIPHIREVIEFLHKEYHLPKPHFNVSFNVAYAFAWLMEKINPIVPWEPLITRSVVHLLEETNVNNEKAKKRLNYIPRYHWQDAIRMQINEMKLKQKKAMSMARPIR
ncbi:MAG: NAD(P)-dependent oxidoreductase [Gammaproteobacteria bacterium]|nr:NAD(P)-dependent oxidoreductase [Gammaproteobacteria bacterium]